LHGNHPFHTHHSSKLESLNQGFPDKHRAALLLECRKDSLLAAGESHRLLSVSLVMAGVGDWDVLLPHGCG
jgi:hypothetical protein